MTAPLANGDLLIRPHTADDTLPLYRAVRASIGSLSYWLPWCHAGYSEADAADWISYCRQAWEARREFPFGIFDRSGELLGGVGLSQVDRANNRRTSVTGWLRRIGAKALRVARPGSLHAWASSSWASPGSRSWCSRTTSPTTRSRRSWARRAKPKRAIA